MRPVVIAGAGLSGAVIARELAEAGQDVTVYETRDHVAGNCYTERDAQTGVLVHRYGPHIFHTGDEEVWDYVQRFARFRSYTHRVRTTTEGRVYSLPVNLGTINQFYNGTLSPAQAQGFISAIAEDIDSPRNFEEQALSMVGRDLYETFFKGYTQKQWGVSPRALPASILKRLPLRFSYEDNYFNHPIQAQPEAGYTPMVQAMLDHPRITLLLNTPLDPNHVPEAAHIFWSGPLDAYFGYALGRLGYRTLDFEHERLMGDAQGCPVMNYGDADVPYTRITEHKHFAPWEHHDQTVITREYSRACGADDIPYYPIRLVNDKALLSQYQQAARAQTRTTFVGRLGTYRYLDMDVCIREALGSAQAYLAAERQHILLPAFIQDPL